MSKQTYKQRQRVKRASEDEPIDMPTVPVSDTTPAAELVAAIDQILEVR